MHRLCILMVEGLTKMLYGLHFGRGTLLVDFNHQQGGVLQGYIDAKSLSQTWLLKPLSYVSLEIQPSCDGSQIPLLAMHNSLSDGATVKLKST